MNTGTGSLKRKQNQKARQEAHQENRERAQINTFRTERGETTTDATKIQSIVRNYYKELFAKKCENLDEIDNFLEKYNLPKLNEEETESLNTPITPDEIETVIRKLPTHSFQKDSKSTGPGSQEISTEHLTGT